MTDYQLFNPAMRLVEFSDFTPIPLNYQPVLILFIFIVGALSIYLQDPL